MKRKNAVVVGYKWKSVGGSFAAMMVRGLRGEAEAFPVPPDELVDWLATNGERFKAIYIIKTYFVGDAARAEAVLQKLKRKGVRIEIAAHEVGLEIGHFEQKLIEIGRLDKETVLERRKAGELTRGLQAKGLVAFFTKDGGDKDLEDEIQNRFHTSTDGLSDIGDLVACDKYFVMNQPGVELIEIGIWHFELYGRADIFNEVVHVLADDEDKSRWSKALVEAIEHYRRFKRRGLVGDSPAMTDLKRNVRRLTRYPDARVMILGESGTGKETVAMQLHYGSMRSKNRFVAFNCASVNPDLIESRLFGYEKGAFTGACQQTPGIFEAADKGTVFLDEIGEMSLEGQGLLLRTLENGTIQRVGGTEEIPIDVRLITATNRNLVEMVKKGKFRADLYYRLNMIQIRIPPLREHKEDIADIVSAWNAHRQTPNGKYVEPPDETAVEALCTYDYPGNVRELLSILERAEIMGETDFAKLIYDYREMNAGLEDAMAKGAVFLPEDLDGAMRCHVRRIFEKYGRNVTRAAHALKVSKNTVRKYL